MFGPKTSLGSLKSIMELRRGRIIPRGAAIACRTKGKLITPGDSPQICQHGGRRHYVERVDTVDGEDSNVRVGFRQRLQNVGHTFRSCPSPQCVLEWSSETFRSHFGSSHFCSNFFLLTWEKRC